MHFWFLKPFPLPFPAPSLVGLITTNALLYGVLVVMGLILGLFFPHLRTVSGLRFFMHVRLRWLIIVGLTSIAGLVALSLWGTLAELPIGFAWSAIYITCYTSLSLGLRQ